MPLLTLCRYATNASEKSPFVLFLTWRTPFSHLGASAMRKQIQLLKPDFPLSLPIWFSNNTHRGIRLPNFVFLWHPMMHLRTRLPGLILIPFSYLRCRLIIETSTKDDCHRARMVAMIIWTFDICFDEEFASFTIFDTQMTVRGLKGSLWQPSSKRQVYLRKYSTPKASRLPFLQITLIVLPFRVIAIYQASTLCFILPGTLLQELLRSSSTLGHWRSSVVIVNFNWCLVGKVLPFLRRRLKVSHPINRHLSFPDLWNDLQSSYPQNTQGVPLKITPSIMLPAWAVLSHNLQWYHNTNSFTTTPTIFQNNLWVQQQASAGGRNDMSFVLYIFIVPYPIKALT